MATRFYLENTAADVDPATERGAWDDSTSYLARRISRVRAGSVSSKGVQQESSLSDWNALVLKLVSEPIPAQAISGTLNWVVGAGEDNALMNAHWHVHAFVIQGATDNLRGTLYTDYTEEAGVNEWPATAAGLGPTGAITLTAVTASDNDRIVIEMGYVARDISSVFTGTLWYGGTSGVELASAGDETVSTGWVEFSQDLFPPRPKRRKPHRTRWPSAGLTIPRSELD